jgi:hypothetical protein
MNEIDQAIYEGLSFEQAVARHMAGTSADDMLTAARAQFPELQHRRRRRERGLDDHRVGARPVAPSVVSASLAEEQSRPAPPPPEPLLPEGFVERHFPEIAARKRSTSRITWGDRS